MSYVDLGDIIVTGKDDADHLKNLEQVLSRLSKYGFKLQRSKCEFMMPCIQYLGHVVDKEGIRKEPCATEAIREAPAPRNTGEMRSFLGLANQYRKFVDNMSTLAEPLNELLQHKKRWKWTERTETAFTEIKRRITQDTVLTHYNPEEKIYLAVDASPVGLGAVISHGRGKEERPIAFASRTLTETEKNYSQIDREALAIIYGRGGQTAALWTHAALLHPDWGSFVVAKSHACSRVHKINLSWLFAHKHQI